MTQDRTPQRTVDVDAESWSPFGGPVPDGTVDADAQPSTVRVDVPSWRPRVIEGGRGHKEASTLDPAPVDEDAASAPGEDAPSVDVLDAAAADALAVLNDPAPTNPAAPAEPEHSATPAAPEPVEEAPQAPATAPESAPQAPAVPAQEATPHPTLHTPAQATPETPAPAQEPVEDSDTPHSTPWLRTAVGWLNPYDVLDQPLPPVSAIYDAAGASVADRSGFDRVTEIGWTYAIGMPITVACYTIAAAVQHKMRGIGVALTVLLWIAAANTAPVDESIVWFWTAVGYWVSTALVLPAIIQAKK